MTTVFSDELERLIFEQSADAAHGHMLPLNGREIHLSRLFDEFTFSDPHAPRFRSGRKTHRRGVKRGLDHESIRARHAAGEPPELLARAFDASLTAIVYIVDEGVRDAMKTRASARQRELRGTPFRRGVSFCSCGARKDVRSCRCQTCARRRNTEHGCCQ